MEIRLVGALNQEKLNQYLKEKGISEENSIEIQKTIEQLVKERRIDVVASAGRLSRFPGNVFEIMEKVEQRPYEKNIKTIERITSMGHDSITDHDYYVFQIKDVSPIVEQTIIEQRFCSFTIKSRREVNFSQAGYLIPNFRDENFQVSKDNQQIQEFYRQHEEKLFQTYQELVDQKIKQEDARFILPYSFYSNIYMGVDAHVLKEMIIDFTKQKNAKIQELKTFGEKLYEIVKENIPYLVAEIESASTKEDEVEQYLNQKMTKEPYEILSKPKLLNRTPKIDEVILTTAIMRRYEYSYEKAKKALNTLSVEEQKVLMKKIAFESDGIELAQVNFLFQIPLSYAVLTHLTRHRTHPIMVPDFVPNVDLTQYKIPPMIQKNSDLLAKYCQMYHENKQLYDRLKKQYHICEEDLIYFTLSGNMANIITNLDGKTLRHILELRECTKAQWETREMAQAIHQEIAKLNDAKIFETILGPNCVTRNICLEKQESCGRILSKEKKGES